MNKGPNSMVHCPYSQPSGSKCGGILLANIEIDAEVSETSQYVRYKATVKCPICKRTAVVRLGVGGVAERVW